jgi:hypothetical protein
MTRKQFEAFRLSVEKETFAQTFADPIVYGIQRTIFRRQKLEKLIHAGRKVKSRTVQAKVRRWTRQLERLQNSQDHLEQLRKELVSSRLEVLAVPISAN